MTINIGDIVPRSRDGLHNSAKGDDYVEVSVANSQRENYGSVQNVDGSYGFGRSFRNIVALGLISSMLFVGGCFTYSDLVGSGLQIMGQRGEAWGRPLNRNQQILFNAAGEQVHRMGARGEMDRRGSHGRGGRVPTNNCEEYTIIRDKKTGKVISFKCW